MRSSAQARRNPVRFYLTIVYALLCRLSECLNIRSTTLGPTQLRRVTLMQTHVPSSLQVPLVDGSKVISSKVNPPFATHTLMVCRPASMRVCLDGGDRKNSHSGYQTHRSSVEKVKEKRRIASVDTWEAAGREVVAGYIIDLEQDRL